jgi:predicted enzyme related to lactoylglutathione lyase
MSSKHPKHPNHIDYVEFPADSPAGIAKVKAFYGAAFSWSYKDWGDSYVDTESSGVSSGFTAHPDKSSKPLVVIYSDDLVAARDRIVKAGGTITKDIFAFPGGKRFHFTDPMGNELAVWSES